MNILFVCLGNICRSPTAEAVFRHRSTASGLHITIESAGTDAWHTGEAPDVRAQAAGRKRGYSFADQSARKVSRQDFEMFDLILAMDKRNLQDLKAMCPSKLHYKLALFLGYASTQTQREVPDPYYGGDDGFESVIDLIELASDGLIDTLKK